MLAIFERNGEVLICEAPVVGGTETPITGGYFSGYEGDGRSKEDYNLTIVEAPIIISPETLPGQPAPPMRVKHGRVLESAS